MNVFSLITGLGYRTYLLAPTAIFIAMYSSADDIIEKMTRRQVKSTDPITVIKEGASVTALLYMIPVGQAIGFAAAIGWLVTCHLQSWSYPLSILLSTQLFMSTVYMLIIGGSTIAIYAGMPVMGVATGLALFSAGKLIFADHNISKALICTGMFAHCGAYVAMMQITKLEESSKWRGLALFPISYLIIEVGYWLGWRAVKREAASKKHQLEYETSSSLISFSTEGTWHQEPAYGSMY